MQTSFALKVGFTGSQTGMNILQKQLVRNTLLALQPIQAHHGVCIGSDADFHQICLDLGIPIVGHPCTIEKKQAKLTGFSYLYEPVEPLRRNWRIVRICDTILATPKELREQLRSGTWTTIRYARKVHKEPMIFYPI